MPFVHPINSIELKNGYIESKVTNDQSRTSILPLPLGDMLFREKMFLIHNREIGHAENRRIVNYKCFPGGVRLYCDIRGNYYTCEKCESSETMALGDVWSGFSVTRSEEILETYRHIADCGNCVAQQHCTNCFTDFFQRDDNVGVLVGEAFDHKCQGSRLSTSDDFSLYTEIMEKNPGAFGDPTVEASIESHTCNSELLEQSDEHEESPFIQMILPENSKIAHLGTEQLTAFWDLQTDDR